MITHNDLSPLADKIAVAIDDYRKVGTIYRVMLEYLDANTMEDTCNDAFNEDIDEHGFIGSVMKAGGGRFNPGSVRDWYRKKTLEIDTANGDAWYVDDYGNDMRYTRD